MLLFYLYALKKLQHIYHLPKLFILVFILIFSSCGGGEKIENQSIDGTPIDTAIAKVETNKHDVDAVPETPQKKPITPAKELYKHYKISIYLNPFSSITLLSHLSSRNAASPAPISSRQFTRKKLALFS